MSGQRTTFLKRQREQNRKDKARAKQERLAARRAAAREARSSSPAIDGAPTSTDAPIALDGQPATRDDDATD
jgi:hypothetical protein